MSEFKTEVEVGDLVALVDVVSEVWEVVEVVSLPHLLDDSYYNIKLVIESLDGHGELTVDLGEILFICKAEHSEEYLDFLWSNERHPNMEEYLNIVAKEDEVEEWSEKIEGLELNIDKLPVENKYDYKTWSDGSSSTHISLSSTRWESVHKKEENPRLVEYDVNRREMPNYAYGIDFARSKISMNGMLDRYNDIVSLLKVFEKEVNCDKKTALELELKNLKELFHDYKLLNKKK